MKRSIPAPAATLAAVFLGFCWTDAAESAVSTDSHPQQVIREDLGENGARAVPQPWSPDAAESFRAVLRRLSDAELYGRRHSFGKSAGRKLQEAIDRRLKHADSSASFARMRVLFHMMILRECQLEEFARRDHERNRFGHRFDGPSSILGTGYSKKYDDDLERIEHQRAELARLFLHRVMAISEGGETAGLPETSSTEESQQLFRPAERS